MDHKTVRGRFAPSPSGRMHLGNIYTAAAAYLLARSAGGEFFLRIEDLDPVRCPRKYADLILDDLIWLGLSWDNDPVPYQSERTKIYERCLALFEQKGLIYPCFCSRSQLHVASAPHASDGRYVYSGRCRDLGPDEVRELLKTKRAATRLILPDLDISFTDGNFGPQHFNLARDWGDIIIRRSDGVFAYQLAVSADDAQMGITQVVRGWDLLSSSAPQIYILSLLGQKAPQYFHLPLLSAEDGSRLSKRDRSADMGFLREKLGRPECLLGHLAFFLGQIKEPEDISLKELLQIFDPAKIPGKDIFVRENFWQKNID